MANTYTIIRRPLITEKGLGAKETEGTLSTVRTANYVGKERRRGKFSGFRPDWKKAYVRLKAGEKMPEYVNSL
jgi:large subunit ribosomal protein L23